MRVSSCQVGFGVLWAGGIYFDILICSSHGLIKMSCFFNWAGSKQQECDQLWW